MNDDLAARERSTAARIGLPLGIAAAAVMLLLAPPSGMPPTAWRVAAVGVLMAVWWITEAAPIPATALVPLAAFPLLGIRPIGETAAPYADEVIFLFLGGFLIAAALERCGLHRRLALAIIAAVGTQPARLVGGFMVATAFLSMWVSNTATTIMLLPMATSVIGLGAAARANIGAASAGEPAGAETATVGREDERASDNFARALLLGIAYAASIGGLGTLIGTPPNALMRGFLSQSYGIEIGFGQWMLIGVPIVVVGLPLTWLLLTHLLFPLGDAGGAGGFVIAREVERLGPLSRAEWVVGVVTTLTAASWILRTKIAAFLPGLSDAGIAMIGAILLFVLPAFEDRRPALGWDDAEALPWGVLILFGGGLSLAGAIQATGLATWIGEALAGIGAWPILLIVVVVTAIIIFLTELTSNTATAAAFLPVVGALAIGIGADPLLLVVPAALAASCAFMMPVATPPNAIVFATGRLTIPQMARAGIWLNLLFVGLLTVAVFALAGPVLGVR